MARRLMHAKPPEGVAFWIVPELNPDGARADTRQNAHGVDLNRNFGWHWRPIDHRGGRYWSGPRAFSEPESRAAKRVIVRIRPRVAVWYHQPLELDPLPAGQPPTLVLHPGAPFCESVNPQPRESPGCLFRRSEGV